MKKKNRNSILQRTIHDLESEIDIAVSRPFDSKLHHHLQLSQSIQHKFLFIRNLLSAETSSNPRRTQHSLKNLEIRLEELEDVFQRWKGDCQDVSVTAVEEDPTDEDRSVCSCTDSSAEGPTDRDSLVDGEFEGAMGEKEEVEEENKRLVQDQMENVALGRIEDTFVKLGHRDVIQRKIGDPPPSKSCKLWKSILVGAISVVILATAMHLECFWNQKMGDNAVGKVIPS